MFHKVAAFIVGTLFFSHSPSAIANEQQKLRKAFVTAEKNIWQPNTSKYQSLYQKLHYYPLQPYLDQQRLIHQMKLSKVAEIDQFLNDYKGTPLDWTLRKKWLSYLAKKKRNALFVKYYQPTSNAELTCQYYHFKLKAGADAAKILPKVTKLWVAGKSQPKVCNPIFDQWQKAGYRTENVIWQRVKLSADGGDHTLLRYLGTLLPKDQQYLAALWKKVRRNPAYVARLKKFPHKSVREQEIMLYGLQRLVWRDPELAIKTFKKAQQVFKFSDQQKHKLTQKFALSLASKQHKKAADWLDRVDNSFVDKSIMQWRIANALQANDWPKIRATLELLPTESQKVNQWQYWYGRSLIETGDIEQGNKLLKKLADNRHYYGFLAASQVSQPVNYQNKPLTVSENEKMTVLKYASAKRAFELFHLGRYHQARKEWNYWLSKLTNRQKLVASRIAFEKKWFDRAIFTLSKVGYLNDVDLRFPLAFAEEMTRLASFNKINPAWAFAIARRESSFMSDANSPVGAKGLMQVMPRTAKQLKRKKVSTKYLLTAENNIALGTLYLRQLLDKYKGNNILATASYNAGPYRVASWVKERPELPADMWIETIPYKETRDYVKSVLAYQQIYQHKVGQSASVFDQLIQTTIN